MKKLILTFLIFFLSFNINAEISREGITNLKQLNNVQIIDALSGYRAIGIYNETYEGINYIGPVEDIHYQNGDWLSLYPEEDLTIYGNWKTENNTLCYKVIGEEFECFYLFGGFRNGEKKIYFSYTRNGDFYGKVDALAEITPDAI